jgi:hypothetical protein
VPLTHTPAEAAALLVPGLVDPSQQAQDVVLIYLTRACYTAFRFRGAVAVGLGGFVEGLGQTQGLLGPFYSMAAPSLWLDLVVEVLVGN